MQMTSSGNDTPAEDFFHVKNFENLLHDSVNLLYAAYDVDRENDGHNLERTFSRGSMLCTLLLFECAANCCIDALHMDGQFASDVDKLPFLSKFELFLGRTNAAPFDRGCKVVQSVCELKSLRDKYVHPKVKKIAPVQIEPNHFVVEAGKTKQLNISHNPVAWRREIGLISAQTANSFFNLFFTTWCGFDSNTICSILMDTDAAQIPSSTSFGIDVGGELDRAISEFELDFAYLGKGHNNS